MAREPRSTWRWKWVWDLDMEQVALDLDLDLDPLAESAMHPQLQSLHPLGQDGFVLPQ